MRTLRIDSIRGPIVFVYGEVRYVLCLSFHFVGRVCVNVFVFLCVFECILYDSVASSGIPDLL